MSDKTPENAKGKENSSKPENNAGVFEYYEVSVQLIKAIIWPLIVIYLFVSLQEPLKATVAQLPSVFTRTRTIKEILLNAGIYSLCFS